MEGYIRIHRNVLEWEHYRTPGMMSMWIHLLLKAFHERTVWQGHTVERGQLVTSISSLAAELSTTPDKVRWRLNTMLRTKLITKQSLQKFSIVTICNYDDYICLAEEKIEDASQAESQAESHPQERRTEKVPKRIEERIQENKKENVLRTLKKETKKPVYLSPPSLQEVTEYAISRGCLVDPGYFFDSNTAKGWKDNKGHPYVDWKAAYRTWEKFERDRRRTTASTVQSLTTISNDETTTYSL